MPLIDKTIDQMKPQFINLVDAVKPPVTVLALDQPSQIQASNVELWFEWLLKYRSPKFRYNHILSIDDKLEMGRGILMSHWQFKTLHSPHTLVRQNLPPRLRALSVGAKSEADADALQALAGEIGLQELFMTTREFRQNEDAIRFAVTRELDLDPDEGKDRQAIKDVMEWLRSGAKEPLTIMKRDVVEDSPAITAISPADLVVPANTCHLQDAARITHKIRFNGVHAVLQAARDRGWDMGATKEILKKLKNKHKTSGNRQDSRFETVEYERRQRERQGISTIDQDTIEFWQICSYYSTAEFGPEQKVVILIHPNFPDMPVKFYRYTRPSMLWPYHSHTFELNKGGFYDPRGLPEILNDLEVEITAQHRGKLNRMTIANSPGFLYRKSAGINPSNFTWVPGQFYPVRDVNNDVRPIEVPNVQFSEEREEQILRTWAEERTGSADSGLSNPLSSLTEPRTATEIRGIETRSRAGRSMRGVLHQEAMQEVYQEFFDLWHSVGPDETWVRLVGSEPLKLTKEELQGKFLFQATGTIGETDPVLDAQKAFARLSALVDPNLQAAVAEKFELDVGEAVADWLEKDDIRLSKRVMRRRSPEEVQAIQQAKAERQAAVDKALTNQPQTPEEMGISAAEMAKKQPFGKAQQVAT